MHPPPTPHLWKWTIDLLCKNNRNCKQVEGSETSKVKSFISFCNTFIWFVPQNKLYDWAIVFWMSNLWKVLLRDVFRNPIKSLWWSFFAKVVNDFYLLTLFAKKLHHRYQASAYKKQGCVTITRLIKKFRGYRRVKSHTPPTK